jgi:hypothetical protein
LIGDVPSLHVQQQLLLPNESRNASVGMTGPPEELAGLNDSIAEGRPEGMPEIGDHTAMDVDPPGGAAGVQSPDSDAGTTEDNMKDLPSKIAIVVRSSLLSLLRTLLCVGMDPLLGDASYYHQCYPP